MKETDFIDSLENATAEDINAAEKSRKSIFAVISDNIRIVILGVCLIALAVSLGYVIHSVVHYVMAGDIYSEAEKFMNDASGVEPMYASARSVPTPDFNDSQQLSPTDAEGYETVIKTVDRDYEKFRNKLYTMKQRLSDLYGWIIIPGTNINYPIMQSSDNEYYLEHSYEGANLRGGSIFADYRCSETLVDNYNLVLYGHHMSANLMFHSLDKYLDEEFYRQNKQIIIYTLDGMYTYEICSVYDTDAYYYYIKTFFSSPDVFVSWATEMVGNSIYPTGAVFSANDRMLTLSTCSNRTADGRLCVQARMVKFYSAN